MKKISFVALFTLSLGLTGLAHADTNYYVYKKGDKCEITMKSPEKFGGDSKWKFVGKDSSRSSAKKRGKIVGCSSF